MSQKRKKSLDLMPWIPLEANIDLTYRCNNNCLHCWIAEPDTEAGRCSELSTREWLELIEQARAMGTREWGISGGEPLLRDDFPEIFSHLARKAMQCTLNTNGTLITPGIAIMLKDKCTVMVSLYGADAAVNDRVTRNPGSFESALAGIAYLKEAGVRFLVQIVPMRENIHQWEEMKALAQRLSPVWRLGASSLILSAAGDRSRDDAIRAQRLSPETIIQLDPPNIPYQERQKPRSGPLRTDRRRTYSHCLTYKRAFHVDPVGSMGFCCYIRENRLRYDLRNGSVREGWESFLPGLAGEEQKHIRFNDGCAACELRDDCQKCPGIAYLEHRFTEAPSDYLCGLQKEKDQFEKRWKARHQRYFQVAGITVEVNSPVAFAEDTFTAAVNAFAVDRPGEDNIQLEHFFSFPEFDEHALGEPVYSQVPWAIYRKGGAWSYIGYSETDRVRQIHRLAVFSNRYSHGRLYAGSENRFRAGHLNSIAMFPTDQVWLAHVLLARQAFYIHSGGLVVDGNGLLFIGHSEAGKTTLAKLFAGQAEVLCDDRNIVRFWNAEGWRVYGTWSHGEMPSVSPSSAPLKALFFLEKSGENALIPILDRMEIRRRLVPCLVRPYVDPEWWEGIWPLASRLIDMIPAYVMRFDTSGAIVPMIRERISIRESEEILASGPG
jgi:molybdenum cofactor biosynthesis enzyme MoaA